MHFGPCFGLVMDILGVHYKPKMCTTWPPLYVKDLYGTIRNILDKRKGSWGEKKTNTFVLRSITIMCKYHTKNGNNYDLESFPTSLMIQSCSRLGSRKLEPQRKNANNQRCQVCIFCFNQSGIFNESIKGTIIQVWKPNTKFLNN
jgi:hypothetical protein